jgi:hypothetical protein
MIIPRQEQSQGTGSPKNMTDERISMHIIKNMTDERISMHIINVLLAQMTVCGFFKRSQVHIAEC